MITGCLLGFWPRHVWTSCIFVGVGLVALQHVFVGVWDVVVVVVVVALLIWFCTRKSAGTRK